MKNALIAIIILLTLNSCATIFGGARYKATVYVNNLDNAKIKYNGINIREGSQLLIKRKDADKVRFTVEKEGYQKQSFNFKKRTFRGTALFFSIISGLGARTQSGPGYTYTQYTFTPWVLIDLFNFSSLWKPSVSEYGVVKNNYNNYKYELNYEGKQIQKSEPPKKQVIEKDEFTIQQEKLRDLKKMYEEEVIDELEYKIMRRKILGISEKDMEIENAEQTDSTNTEILQKKEEKTIPIKEINTVPKKEKEIETKNESSPKTTPLNEEDKQKLKDLNKMLELEMITQEEYNEMKAALIDKK